METIDISYWGLAAIYGLLLMPIALSVWLRLGLVREVLIAFARMSVQLALVGLYLKVIFDLNSIWINLAWMLVMLVVANASVLKQAGLARQRFFWLTLLGIALGTAGVVGFFVMVVIRPHPLYDARYLVPVFGMVLGNCMRGNVMSLERFFAGIRENEKEFVTFHTLGASLLEATQPYLRRALRAAVGPMLSTVATMGIVSLPGMMTGQILGGSFPTTAIKYQCAIVVCIFSAMTIAAVLSLLLCVRLAFDEYGMLRADCFAKSHS